MSTKARWIFITLVVAVVSFFLAPMIWPHPADMMPSSSQLPFFIILSVAESLALGTGVAFLILGYPFLAKFSGKDKIVATKFFVATAWILVNWWPHDNLHMINGMNLQGLLYIEYGFHVTLIIAGAVIAHSFFYFFSKKK